MPTVTHQWYNTTLCTELYKDAMEEDPIIQREFTNELGNVWWCPDVTQFTIHNDPVLYPYANGTNFVMVVNTCNTAKTVAADNKLYWDDSIVCKDNTIE